MSYLECSYCNGTFYESVFEFLNNKIESIRRISLPPLKADLVDRTTESSREGPSGSLARCVIHEVLPWIKILHIIFIIK